jgi:hypothetical protein
MLIEKAQEKAVIPLGNIVGNVGRQLHGESNLRSKAIGKAADIIAAAEGASITPGGQRAVRNVAAGLAAPAAAGLAGLGGVALGAIPGAVGVPGFVQDAAVDPEAYGSSNSVGARYKTSTMQYV